MNTPLRTLALALTSAALLTACSSGTGSGDTNVERGYNKKGPAAEANGVPNGDSITSGTARDTGAHRPTGRELYKAAGEAKDRNHDGIAD